jgi:hypothetical protein
MKKICFLLIFCLVGVLSSANSSIAKTPSTKSFSVEFFKNADLNESALSGDCLAYFYAWSLAFAGYMQAAPGSWQEFYYLGQMGYYEYMLAVECDF